MMYNMESLPISSSLVFILLWVFGVAATVWKNTTESS